MTKRSLRVLILEDCPTDVELVLGELYRVGFDPVWYHVETEADYIAHLRQDLEIILADYSLPAFDALEALRLKQQHGLDIPFIVVTGAIGEEQAVECIKHGATDYLLKDRLARLGPAVQQALYAHALQRENRQAEAALRASEARYRLLVENVPLGILEIDRQGCLLSMNPAGLHMFGITDTHQTGGRTYLTMVAEEDRQRLQAMLELAFQGKAVELEIAVAGDTSRPRIIAASFVPVQDSDGAVLKLIGTTKDITESIRTVDALKSAKEYAENLINSSLDIIVSVDADRRIMEFNPAAERAFGYIKDDVLGHPVDLLYSNPMQAQHIGECMAQIGTFTGEVSSKRRDGRLFETYLSASVMRDSHGNVIGVMGISRDITERKALEAQLAQAQKLEAIGRLAAGIAHEINTPTQFVGDNLRFLQEAFQDLHTLLTHYAACVDTYHLGMTIETALRELAATAKTIDLAFLSSEIPAAIGQSLDGITRVAEIVRAMKDFSHPGSDEKTAIDLNKAIESTITVARNEWKYVAQLVTDFDPTLPLVPCLPGEFNQVVLNMVVNAAHAIAAVSSHAQADKGTITIRTRRDGNWAEVCIADTGTGIPVAVRDKLFDPFFTTKDVGKGTGQGLTIAYDVIVKKHGGAITFDTVEGQGTRFFVRLPLEAPVRQGETAG